MSVAARWVRLDPPDFKAEITAQGLPVCTAQTPSMRQVFRHERQTRLLALGCIRFEPGARGASRRRQGTGFHDSGFARWQAFHVLPLADALKKGPVVLYFYPAAFTPGCTIEAHDFAEATDKFKALGATVIGVSYDNIDTLNKFSVSECRSKFARRLRRGPEDHEGLRRSC